MPDHYEATGTVHSTENHELWFDYYFKSEASPTSKLFKINIPLTCGIEKSENTLLGVTRYVKSKHIDDVEFMYNGSLGAQLETTTNFTMTGEHIIAGLPRIIMLVMCNKSSINPNPFIVLEWSAPPGNFQLAMIFRKAHE